MRKPFQRNLATYAIRGNSVAAAKIINAYMADAHSQMGHGGLEYNWDALNPIRALSDEEALATLLLAYEHFLWLLDPPSATGEKFGDNIIYASGLDFAIQILARRAGLPFTSEDLGRLTKAYLSHPGATPCLPPRIIVALIAKFAGKLARARALVPQTTRLLRRLIAVLKAWDREEGGSMPPTLLRRIEKALAVRS